MARWLICLLLVGVAWAQTVLQCKKEIALTGSTESPPTDVVVDEKGRIFVLYEGDGFLDVYSDRGELLQHRGGRAEESLELTAVTPLSQWVGRLGKSAVLVSEPKQHVIRAVLIPGEKGFDTIPLTGTPTPLTGLAALARDTAGLIYVWVQQDAKVYVFDGNGNYSDSVSVPGLKRPVQLSVDSQGDLYCLDAAGLHVFTREGSPKFEVSGAVAQYLTGSDVLALAGRDWLRRYGPEGQLEVELRELEGLRNKEPIAISINDEGQFFVYFRDPESGAGNVQKLSSKGQVLTDFPQGARMPAQPDPGTRLDYQGRLHLWDGKAGRLLRIHPGGKLERSLVYVKSSEPKGRLQNPADLMLAPDGVVWIADAGNSRLQRFSMASRDWLKPIGIGIRNGDARGMPRSLALGRGGIFYCVVYPRNSQQDVVLQTRDMNGKLLAQKSVGSAYGDPIVRVASAPNGDIYLYRSRVKTARGWEENPALTRFDARGNKVAEIGGDGPPFSPPGRPGERLILKPQEDMVFYAGRMLMAVGGTLYEVAPDLRVTREYKLNFKRGGAGRLRMGEYGGAYVRDKILYLTDMSNSCVERVVLP